MARTSKKYSLIGIAFVAVFLAVAGYYMTVSAAQTLAQNRPGLIIRGRVASTYASPTDEDPPQA